VALYFSSYKEFIYQVREDSLIKKRKLKIVLIYKEIQMASGAKSYMRKDVVICEDMHKYFTIIYEETFNNI
jgi:hypothetical protein